MDNEEALRPLHDLVLVEKLDGEQKTPGGVILPDHSKKTRTERGRVLKVGPGKAGAQLGPVEVPLKPGDVVVFWKNQGAEVVLDNRNLLLINYEQLLAVIR